MNEKKICLMMPDTMSDKPVTERKTRLMVGKEEIPGVISLMEGKNFGDSKTLLIEVLADSIEVKHKA